MVVRSFSMAELARRCDGQLLGQDMSFEHVSIDSRDCANALFVALKGERFDGHDFICDVAQQHAVACVVEQTVETQLPVLKVEDCREALGWAGAMNRDACTGPVIALTGSSGKTTTKNMLSSILQRCGKTTATSANHNNEIGVPLTLLDIGADTEFVVVEIGARHTGDITYLGQFVNPDVALVVNAGSAHIGEFGSYDNIVKAKGEIYQTLKAGGVAVVNQDDPAAAIWLSGLDGQKLIRFTLEDELPDAADEHNLLRAHAIELNSDASLFELSFNGQSVRVELNSPGLHNIQSAAAAAAAALACNIALDTVAEGLSNLSQKDVRMQMLVTEEGIRVLDDSYNANPVSMRAAVDVLAMQAGRRYAALGTMAELGAEAEVQHVELARYAKKSGIEGLFLTGAYAEKMASAFGTDAVVFPSLDAMKEAIQSKLVKGDSLLVKGSRSAGMDVLAKALTGGSN